MYINQLHLSLVLPSTNNLLTNNSMKSHSMSYHSCYAQQILSKGRNHFLPLACQISAAFCKNAPKGLMCPSSDLNEVSPLVYRSNATLASMMCGSLHIIKCIAPSTSSSSSNMQLHGLLYFDTSCRPNLSMYF